MYRAHRASTVTRNVYYACTLYNAYKAQKLNDHDREYTWSAKSEEYSQSEYFGFFCVVALFKNKAHTHTHTHTVTIPGVLQTYKILQPFLKCYIIIADHG